MNVFVESLKRLYRDGKLNAEKVVELFESKKITEEEKWEILNAHKGL
jgi:hypothetical protein